MADKIKASIRIKGVGVNGHESYVGTKKISNFRASYGDNYIGHEYKGNDLIIHVYKPVDKKVKYEPKSYSNYKETSLDGKSNGYYFKLDDRDGMYMVYDNSGRIAPHIKFGRSALDRMNKRLITSFNGDAVDIFNARPSSPQDSPSVLGDGYYDRTSEAIQIKNSFASQYKEITGRLPPESLMYNIMKNIKIDKNGRGSYKIGSKTISIDNAKLLKDYQTAISSESTRNIRDMMNVSTYINRKSYDDYSEAMKKDMSMNNYIGMGVGTVAGGVASYFGSPLAGGMAAGAVSSGFEGLLNHGDSMTHFDMLYKRGLNSLHNKYASMLANDNGSNRKAINEEYNRELNGFKESFKRMRTNAESELNKQWGVDVLAGTATGAALSAILPSADRWLSKNVAHPINDFLKTKATGLISKGISNSSYTTKRMLINSSSMLKKAIEVSDDGMQKFGKFILKNPVSRGIGYLERWAGEIPYIRAVTPKPMVAPKPLSAFGNLVKTSYKDFLDEPLNVFLKSRMGAQATFDGIGGMTNAAINGGTYDFLYNLS